MGLNYDLVVHRPEVEETYSYMLEWGDEGSAPMSVESAPPDVPVSTSSGVTQAGGQFSARDAAPPYPIEINNWQDGAGQATYDKTDSSPEAYKVSYAVDVTQDGHFELGPRNIPFPDWFMSNKVYAALGTFWAGFTPEANADSDQPGTLRFLHRYTVVSGSNATDYLGDTTDTSMVISAIENLVDLSLSETLDAPIAQDIVHESSPGHIMGDYLYCPTHNEVIHVTATTIGTKTLTVERGKAGTTASAHTAGETWYGFNWTPVLFAETEPTQALSALSTDGKYVYAAFHDAGTDPNGSVWRGTVTDTTEWTSFDARNNITALCFCGGYMYGAQDNLSGVTSAGWFNTASSNAYTAISLTGAISFGASTAGLVAVGNYAYWVVTDSISRSWVYRIQHSSADTFELVSELPAGFVATCAHSHLGSLYIGGYIDNLATNTSDTDLPQYEGALYLVSSDGGVTLAARLRFLWDGGAPDTRIKGLASSGPYIYMNTNESLCLYDTQHGAWSHYATTSNSSVSGETADIDWDTAGFYYDPSPAGGAILPTAEDAITTSYASWVDDPDDTYMAAANVVGAASSGANFTATDIGGVYRLKADAGQWKDWVIDGLPTSQGTLQVWAQNLQSQAGCFVMGGTSKEVRVYLQGVMSGGAVTAHRVWLGYMTDSTGAVSDYSYRLSGALSPEDHVYRITLSSSGARVYVDEVLALEATYDELRDVTGDEASRIRWSVGWPGDGRTDTYNERMTILGLWFDSSGAYSPDYAGGTLTTTSMKDVAAMQGVVLIPLPGNGTNNGGWNYINTNEVTHMGYLETSDSAFHMGSINKYFTTVLVEHSELKDGQSLVVSPVVDDVVTGSTSATALTKLTTATVNTSGKKIRVQVNIYDTDPDRPYTDRLRVYRITARFFPFNSPHVHTYYLNCREGVQCRTGHDWGYDPENAIRHLFSAADSGEVVYIESLFTSNVDEGEATEGKQQARIEQVKLYQGPGDMQRYDKLTGTVMVKLRKVSE